MSLHGLGTMTLGVPRVQEACGFYREFGLTETKPGTFASADGGEQLRIVEKPYRQLVAVSLAADNLDDIARIASRAEAKGLAVNTLADGSIGLTEPATGLSISVEVRSRIEQSTFRSPTMNGPGPAARDGERAPAIFSGGPAGRDGSATCSTPRLTQLHRSTFCRTCSVSR